MTPTVFLAVLGAAAMHAIWNAVVKVHPDRFLSIMLMTVGTGVAALLVLPFVAFPTAAVWPWIILSVLFHMGYKLFLVAAYEAGDLAQTYPLARGAAPLLTTLGGILVVSEIPTHLAILGIVLLSLGTFVMSFRGGPDRGTFNPRAVGYALATSLFVAGYTLSDGSGARLAATATSYAAWLYVCDGVWSLGVCLVARGANCLPMMARDWRKGLVTGLLGATAYWIAMWAMTKAPIASVASLRETSILFAMLISVFALGERATAWRIAAGVSIVAGVVALRLG